jgi:CheY-like chemotaxis protein/chemotaxis protein CheY-P-specific phosphatase CheC
MNVLICDDSALARKTLHRFVDSQFLVECQFSENGRDALMVLQDQPIDILFLDLTMPVMDGFEVLQSLPVNDYPTTVIVISGDVQNEAKKRVLSLGAHAFVDKPFNKETLTTLLRQFGVPEKDSQEEVASTPSDAKSEISPQTKFKEVANIALGSAAALFSDKIGAFINLPLPNVGILEANDLKMAILDAVQRDHIHAVSQRFVGSGVHGEALACMRGDGMREIGEKLGFISDSDVHDEVALNVANLLISTFLNSLADQLVASFSLRQPIVLSNSYFDASSVSNIREGAFAIEFTYVAEALDFECEVLFFIDSHSVDTVYRLMENM